MKQRTIRLAGPAQRAHAIRAIAATGWRKLRSRSVICVTFHGEKRNAEQNAALWGWCAILGDHLGYTKDEMKHTLCAMYLPGIVTEESELERCRVRGNLVTVHDPSMAIPQSLQIPDKWETAKLSKESFAALLTRIDRLAGEHGVILPRSQHGWQEVA